MSALLVDKLDVVFGRFRALTALSLAVDAGEVRAVIGPNGAGKTTLLDVISGITKPLRGRVMLGDSLDLAKCSEAGIAKAGVRRKFQKPSVFPALTVYENLDIGCGAGLPASERAARIGAVLGEIGLEPRAHALAGALAHGEKQWLEIGMVLGSNPRIILLDEPVAGLSDAETERTAALIRALRRPDRAIVVIEHDMAFVEAIADRVTVLHEGRTLYEGGMRGARADARVIEVFLGR
ncbi:ATP-binding cassette domain-containing protein [Methylobacterium sp. E-041]|uniref:ATP-binding cassette domain-containing protein n=1 Tax=unclassified Methylobacterium TaxID=2615210 RepID=UPI0011C88985|nr:MULTISPECIES: ATP-binding cassette domain-containing protein [unclassified Methylobacterium]MCJ2105563.1 ATP-binding cassette domain-containing protein [Methylobacterium sp. E-041]MCJ2109939.1 ATP-binding cassette domain-containing protein [Methylobacterium sp. E-025]TXN41863.1 ATP-binding cassette domain-containing protein [Methylobacterium sp. WL93]TXN51825.1 ATP-binding cassette domain-containing protein [Methylobacterium sp. WL119]TXN68912.1 ATP-binding cassette domain-containing protei